MMSRILRIARTEVLEHRRQPWMIVILALNYALFLGGFGIPMMLLDRAVSDPAGRALLEQQMATLGVDLHPALYVAASSFGAILLTTLPLYVAIMSGLSVLHDRDNGTMPFLLLAPITRRQLLAGKLAGAMVIPLVLHVVFVGAGSLALGRLPVLAPYAQMYGAVPAWWVAFLVGAPASAVFVGALGTVISALSRDVRTSMQYTSFFMGLLSLGIGYVLVDAIPRGIGLQLVYAGGCAVAASLTLLIGARLISRDL